MSKITGTQCDVCGKVFHSDVNPAPVRIVLQVITEQDHSNGTKDICSNICLHKLAVERRQADGSIRKPGKEDK